MSSPLQQFGDYELIPECIPISQRNEAENVCSEQLMNEKASFKDKMKDILSCQICCELKRCPIYQCKYGHLICAGCFNNLLAESQNQNEISSCPSCHTTIGIDICYRNIAVEKTISELPVACPHCTKLFPPQNLSYHKSICGYRPVKCANAIIGCSWKGSCIEKDSHEKECKQLSYGGDKILESLTAIDSRCKKDQALYSSIIDLLSVEKIAYSDLQLKQVGKNSNMTETSIFSALDKQWILRVFISDNPAIYDPAPSIFFHKLVLKTKPMCSVNVKYVILPGPLNDMEIDPDVHQFKFSDEVLETPDRLLELPRSTDVKCFLNAKRVNIRIIMFLVQ